MDFRVNPVLARNNCICTCRQNLCRNEPFKDECGKITRYCIQYDCSGEFSMLVTQEHIKTHFLLRGTK